MLTLTITQNGKILFSFAVVLAVLGANFIFFMQYTFEKRFFEKDEQDLQNQESGKSLSKLIDQHFLEQRKVFLWDVVTDKMVREVVSQLLFLDARKPGEDIFLFINSPGGSVSAGMVIYDVIQILSSPVNTICMGLAASMGAILLAAGKAGKRSALAHAEIMIHQPLIGGKFAGTSADIAIQAEQIKKTKQLGAEILARHCKQPVKRILQDFDRDYWLSAKEAMEYGLIDQVLDKLP